MIEELQQTHDLKAMQTLVTAQEEERKRIAQDLHDGIGGMLASLRHQGDRVYHSSQSNDPKEISEYHRQMDEISAELRRAALNMMPHALIRMGLSAALEDLAGVIQKREGIQVSYQSIDYENPLTQDKEITLYRVAQELCTNVVKHANAQHLLIQLSNHQDTATLVVEDDGIGFDMQSKSSFGIGMESIQSRVAYLNGDMEIYSKPGEGTSVTIQIPAE
jgi:signal transduction histidine kinase